jgi:hypothetical protein
LAWIAFRVKDTNDMLYSMQKYILLDFQIKDTSTFMLTQKYAIALMILFLALSYITYKKADLLEKIANYRLRYWAIFLLIISLAILFFYEGNPENFIYFQF